MQDVSDKLLDQFVECLKTTLRGPEPAAVSVLTPRPAVALSD